jgi:hypothetical protein
MTFLGTSEGGKIFPERVSGNIFKISLETSSQILNK